MIGGPSSGRAYGPACSGAARCDWVPAAYACPRRLFSGHPPFSEKPSRSQLLGKLQAVSVGIEHVEKAHLAVELEDDADLDTLIP